MEASLMESNHNILYLPPAFFFGGLKVATTERVGKPPMGHLMQVTLTRELPGSQERNLSQVVLMAP